MNRTSPFLVAAAALLGAISTPMPSASAGGLAAQQPAQVDLRPRYVSGQQVRYTMETVSRSELKCEEVPEMDGKQSMAQTIGLTLKVVEAGSDGATLQLIYDTVKVKFDSEDGAAEFDSAAPAPSRQQNKRPAQPQADPELSKMLESLVRGMVGAKLEIKTDAAGNIVSVSGDGGISSASRSFMQSAGQNIPGLPGALPSGGEMAKWLVRGTHSTGLASVGESWTNEDSLGGTPLGDFKMTTRHTLQSHAGGTAKVAFTGRAEAASAAGAPSALGFQLKGCSHDGSYDWDTARGMLSKMDADMRVSLEGALTGMNIKHESVNTVKVRRIEDQRPSPRPER